MSSLSSAVAARLLVVMDLLGLLVATLVATLGSLPEVDARTVGDFLSLRLKIQNGLLTLLLLAGWFQVFQVLDLYEERVWSNPLDSIGRLTLAAGSTVVLFTLVALVFHIQMATPLFVAIFGAISLLFLVGDRVLLARIVAPIFFPGHEEHLVLIVGSGRRAAEAESRLKAQAGTHPRIIGFVDEHWEGVDEMKALGYEFLGSLSDFSRIISERVVDEVALCLPLRSRYSEAREILRDSEQQGISVTMPGAVFDSSVATAIVESNGGDPYIAYHTAGIGSAGAMAKRAMDLVLATLALVAASPLFLILPVLIRLNSPGPVFFVQDRRGLHKRVFRIVKFRTMYEDADRCIEQYLHLNEEDGPAFKIRNDPRITRMGHWLRRTSLDELPQLLNVLKGDMSLVGPRPLFNFEFARVTEPQILRRQSVKPGITGLWQVNGRNDILFDSRIELDLRYVDEWSLWLDIKVLLKTIPAVLTGKGAM